MAYREVAADREKTPRTSRGVSQALRWLSALPWLLVLVLSALNVLYMSRLGPNDDAYITYRVARNLAAGLGPVYNPGERVLTVTTPGYMLLLAAGSVVSQDFVRLGLALNGLALLAVGALVIRLSSDDNTSADGANDVRLRSLLSSTLAVSITLTFPLLSQAIGMETPLFMAAILASFAAYRRALQSSNDRRSETRWLLWTAAAAALAFLMRPDGLLVGIAIGLHWIVTQRRVAWRPAALFVLLSLPWLVFAWLYYGSPVPNTLVAKATQALAASIPTWGPGLVQAANAWVRQFPVAAGLALIGLVLALVRRQNGRSPMVLWAALTIIAHSLLHVRSYYWYYVPFAPVLGLLAGDAVAAGIDWLGVTTGRRRLAGLVIGLIALAVAFIPAATSAAALAEPPGLRSRKQVYLQSAGVLRELCAVHDDTFQVGMGEIGLIGYVSNCPLVDFAGLLQRDVAHLSLSPAEKITWVIQRYQPDFLVLAGAQHNRELVAKQPWFRQRYEPIHEAQVSNFGSVIYQRRNGPETQRDLPDAAWWRTTDQTEASHQTLYFAPGASLAITLHTFLPPESSLVVDANGQPVLSLAGDRLGWQDVRLPTVATVDGQVQLSLTGKAGDQPAAVAWIDSRALPAVHYFEPMEDISTRPRPAIRLDPGESRSVQLARPGEDPVALEILYRDRAGVRLAVIVDGQLRDTIGGTDSWRVDQVPLPDAPVYTIEIRNAGNTAVAVAHVALVAPFEAAPQENQRPQ